MFSSDLEVSKLLSTFLTDADVLILAGDIGYFAHYYNKHRKYMSNTLACLSDHYPYVLYVPGNHEYYKFSIVHGRALTKIIHDQFPNIYMDGLVSINNHRFLLKTLWFEPDPNHIYCNWKGMSDSRIIAANQLPLYTSNGILMEDIASLQCFEQMGLEETSWLAKNMLPGDIIVTHHLPSWQLVAPQYKSSRLTHFFVNEDAEVLISNYKPAYWIFGHTHFSIKKKICETICISNPVGYPHEYPLKYFNRYLMLEV